MDRTPPAREIPTAAQARTAKQNAVYDARLTLRGPALETENTDVTTVEKGYFVTRNDEFLHGVRIDAKSHGDLDTDGTSETHCSGLVRRLQFDPNVVVIDNPIVVNRYRKCAGRGGRISIVH